MDVSRREKIRMLVRILDSIAEEVRRVSSEEEDMLSSGSAPSKETEAGLISEEALHYLATAHIALSDALYHMKVAVGACLRRWQRCNVGSVFPQRQGPAHVKSQPTHAHVAHFSEGDFGRSFHVAAVAAFNSASRIPIYCS